MAVVQRAGLMRARITVQSAVSSTNVYGEVTRGWSSTAIGTIWAQAEVREGTYRYESGADRTTLPVIFRIRYRSDITEKDNRILWPAGSTANAYRIESVVDLEGRSKITELWTVKRG